MPAGTPHVPVAIVGAGACGLTRGAVPARRRHRLRAARTRRRHRKARPRCRRASSRPPAPRCSARPACTTTAPRASPPTSRPRRTAARRRTWWPAYTEAIGAGARRAAAAPRPALRAARRLSLPGPHACGACTRCRSAPAPRWWRRCKRPPSAAGATLLTQRAGATSCGATRTTACSASATGGPTARDEHLACDALLLACNGFGGNAAMVRELLPEMRDAVFAGHAGNDGSAIAWGRALGARAGRPGRLPGPRLVGRAARRADHLGADDGRRHPGQRRRAALPRRDRAATPKPRCTCWRSPAAWRGTCSTTRLLALARGFPDFVDAESGRRGARRAPTPQHWPSLIGCDASRRSTDTLAGTTPARRRTTRSASPARCSTPRAGSTSTRSCACAARRRHAAAQPAGRRRRRARRLGQRGVGLPVGQRPAQRRGRRLHRGAHRRRTVAEVPHDHSTLQTTSARAARAARARRLRRAVGADRRTGRLRGAVPVRRLDRLHAAGPQRRRPHHLQRGRRTRWRASPSAWRCR